MSQSWLQKKLNALELYTIDVILGRRAGTGAAIYGALLQTLSWLFSIVAQTRLWLYRHRILHDQPLGCLVVVVGNLTVGGTGKTPVVEKFARALRDRGLWLVGLAEEAGQALYEADLCRPLGLVLGAEGAGLRRLTREHCDQLVGIPMAGAVASLNVSVAAGVSLYEARRQRRAAAPGG
jgi:hypothetical protein